VRFVSKGSHPSSGAHQPIAYCKRRATASPPAKRLKSLTTARRREGGAPGRSRAPCPDRYVLRMRLEGPLRGGCLRGIDLVGGAQTGPVPRRRPWRASCRIVKPAVRSPRSRRGLKKALANVAAGETRQALTEVGEENLCQPSLAFEDFIRSVSKRFKRHRPGRIGGKTQSNLNLASRRGSFNRFCHGTAPELPKGGEIRGGRRSGTSLRLEMLASRAHRVAASFALNQVLIEASDTAAALSDLLNNATPLAKLLVRVRCRRNRPQDGHLCQVC